MKCGNCGHGLTVVGRITGFDNEKVHYRHDYGHSTFCNCVLPIPKRTVLGGEE